MHGTFGSWELVEPCGYERNWYAIEVFEGTTYLAGNNLLAKVENNKIVEVDTGLDRPVTTYKLHANEGLLWSIGERDILSFDGDKWTKLFHGDND